MLKMSGGSVSLLSSCSGIRTRHLYSFSFPSFSFTFRHQPQHAFSFPKHLKLMSQSSSTLNSAVVEEAGDSSAAPPLFDYHRIDQKLLKDIVYDALVWSTLNCLLVGDKSDQVQLCYCLSLYTFDCLAY